ncbi:hypothetical protein JWG40_03810 [Leptospira sp. 201903074]|uniref:hypothetical protein n=1 Tax=Leptospira abararensis TaxID=2810036 RepID=UPI0019669708|nr:hypothetical protein [Leptospira abararensis]MBM9546126.1 hypothetical protein [Leptospira abararensis]
MNKKISSILAEIGKEQQGNENCRTIDDLDSEIHHLPIELGSIVDDYDEDADGSILREALISNAAMIVGIIAAMDEAN